MTTAQSVRRAATAAVLALALASPALAQSGDPDFVLVNNSSVQIDILNASPVTDQNWGADRLGNDVVPPGGRYTVRLRSPGVCQWDVRVIYQNRTAEERRNINLCNITELPFDGSGARAAQ
jgi:hypothetical protein